MQYTKVLSTDLIEWHLVAIFFTDLNIMLIIIHIQILIHILTQICENMPKLVHPVNINIIDNY